MGRLSDYVNSRSSKPQPARTGTKAVSDYELRIAILKIRALGDAVSNRQRKYILRKGAIILRDAARANVPIAAEPYTIYKNGKPFASTYPGFVRDAIAVRNLRKSNDLWVGVEKKDGILAYWAQWLEFGATNRDGTRREGFGFMRKAIAQTKDAVITQIVKDAEALLKRTIKKLSK